MLLRSFGGLFPFAALLLIVTQGSPDDTASNCQSYSGVVYYRYSRGSTQHTLPLLPYLLPLRLRQAGGIPGN